MKFDYKRYALYETQFSAPSMRERVASGNLCEAEAPTEQSESRICDSKD